METDGLKHASHQRMAHSGRPAHGWLAAGLLVCALAQADEASTTQQGITNSNMEANSPVAAQNSVEAQVSLVGIDDASCAEKDGKLMVLQARPGQPPLEVWVDRWFMQVQTPDHTRHRLLPGESAALGCSMSRAGEQHWTIYSVRPAP